MSRAAALTPEPPTVGSILTLLAAIERRADTDAANLGFKAALARKGREAHAAGGLAALEALLRAVTDAEPARADAREAILSAAWADLPGWRP